MKRIWNNIILSVFGLALCISSCSDWTELETKYNENMTGSTKSPEYYEQLRAYKKTDHPITFGWFGNWTGKGASLEKCLAGLPDSVDVVSIWGNWRNISPDQEG